MQEKQASQQCKVAAVAMAAVLCLLSSCAGKNSDMKGDSPDAAAISDAALFEGEGSAVTATEVKDSEVFSDLTTTAVAPAEMTVSSEGSGAGTLESSEDGAFYQAIGGESLERVAYTLYGSKTYAKRLLKKNPDLKDVKALAAEQKVYFELKNIRPQPNYLTKDLLKRYPSQLAEHLSAWREKKGEGKSTVTIASGETLQSISQRLYGSSRYWPELFLLNTDKIQDYDRIPIGLTLAVYEHGGAAVPAAEQKAEGNSVPLVAPASGAVLPPPVAEPVRPAPPAPEPVVSPAPVATQPFAPSPSLDPIPETPSQPTVAAVKYAAPAPAAAPEEELGSSSNLRRALYVTLVLLLGGIAFYLTRPKRKPKFDMLDMTAADTAERPKLTPAPQEHTQHNIG